jgi:flagellar M-ring protein FliF
MDFLNKVYAQLKDLLQSMTPAARITTGLLLAVVVISLVYLFRTGVPGGDEYLLGARAFSIEELQDMEAAFATAGLKNYQLEGNRIRVPRGQRQAYMAAMGEAEALPSNSFDYIEKALSKPGVFVSKDMQQARLKTAKERELALVLGKFSGIERGTVQYDITETRTFPRTRIATATVAVRPKAGFELDASRIDSIRDMVAAAIADLKSEDVSVTDLSSGITHSGSALTGERGRGRLYAKIKGEYEKDWTDKIRTALSYIPDVVVTANVELDTDLRRTSQGSKLDPKGFTYRSLDQTKETTSTSPTPGGRPGSQTQSIMGGGANSQPQARNETTENTSEATKITDREDFIADKAPLIPKQVTVSVSIPSDYYREVWAQRNPPVDGQPPAEPTATDLQRVEDDIKSNVEDTVVGLLPVLKSDDAPYPQVKVMTFQSLAAVEPPPPAATKKAMTWLGENWSTLGMISVGLFGLLMLRSMVRSAPPSKATEALDSPVSLGIAQTDHDESEKEDDEESVRALRRSFNASGPNLKEELTEMVRGNPDTAANILRNWIGTPA